MLSGKMTWQVFDRYILGARVFPVCVAAAPLFLAVSAWFPTSQWPQKFFGASVVLAIAAFALSQLARERGKAIEVRLWASWGGPPSATMLRHRDGTFDTGTKARMHRRLIELGVVDHMPSEQEEEQYPQDADKIYRTCSEWVRRKALELKAKAPFDVVHAENIAYGYCRNLLGIRKIAFAIALMSVAAILPAFFFGRLPIVEIGGALVLLVYVAVIVNETRVKRAADNYAYRLLSAIESIPGPKTRAKRAVKRLSKHDGMAK